MHGVVWFYVVPVQHCEGFLSLAALCVLRLPSGWNSEQGKTSEYAWVHLSTQLNAHLFKTNIEQPPNTNILFLTKASIESWRGVLVADPGRTGAALHHSCVQQRMTVFLLHVKQILIQHWQIVTYCFTVSYVTSCSQTVLKKRNFSHRRRCCRTAILVCSSRTEGSNVADCTPSFLCFKLQ